MIICKASKILTKNDSCDCQSHQAGISIPPLVQDTEIFPVLSKRILNHTVPLTFIDEYGVYWNLQYKYYNSRLFGTLHGHNEHRLTCTTDFVNRYQVHTGDEVWFAIDDRGIRHIGFRHIQSQAQPPTSLSTCQQKINSQVIDTSFFDNNDEDYIIELSGSWKKYTYKK